MEAAAPADRAAQIQTRAIRALAIRGLTSQALVIRARITRARAIGAAPAEPDRAKQVPIAGMIPTRARAAPAARPASVEPRAAGADRVEARAPLAALEVEVAPARRARPMDIRVGRPADRPARAGGRARLAVADTKDNGAHRLVRPVSSASVVKPDRLTPHPFRSRHRPARLRAPPRSPGSHPARAARCGKKCADRQSTASAQYRELCERWLCLPE